MSSNKKGLGRGFDSLIPTELFDESFDPTAEQDEKVSELRHIRVDAIEADPDQPRRTFDEIALDELAISIAEHGVVQPIVVTATGGKYQIVAGERRWRAAKKAGLEKVPAIVRTLSDQHKLELSLIENLQRQDLNVMETATAYLKLRDQFNLTLDEIGQRVGGKSPSSISNTLRLLRLPESVKEALAEGKVREGQVRPLVNIDSRVVEEVLPKIVDEEWSARKVEQYVVQVKKSEKESSQVKRQLPAMMVGPYEKELIRFKKRFDTDVSVKTNTKGAGQIIIRFKNDDEFQRIKKILDD
ncbi:MAG TPA: ParB/RepB/Spo0J family partition protein [Candidatus Saccharimonadales bacterium]|nr:ParB/RepB/Spo0J family partition protein [Candidatus Saccharimonadales bacterium]